jgi:molecular chaperone GrpE
LVNDINNALATEFMHRYQTLLKDYQNLQTRTDRKIADAADSGRADLLLAILPAVDSLKNALTHAGNNDSTGQFAAGFELWARQFLEILEKQGLQTIAAPGELFNPNLHESVGGVPGNATQIGKIAEVCLPGYAFREKLLRVARVRIFVE